MKKQYLFTMALAGLTAVQCLAQQEPKISSFEQFGLQPNSVKNGSGAQVEADFTSGKVVFPNVYQTDYAYWSTGWSYSTMQNDTTPGYKNLYAAYPKAGNNASAKYAVGQQNSILRLIDSDKGKAVKGLYITNGTFAALSMKNGDNIAKKFGGASGNDPDYFVVSIKKFLNGVEGTDSVNCYLADFRSANNADDYILNTWKWVDVSSLGNVDSLSFRLWSSDVGQFGINTPTFFCLDDVITDSDTADFENLTLGANKFWNKRNVKLANEFTEGAVVLANSYSVSNYGDFWSSGFAVSNMKDTTTAGYANLYTSYAGTGADSTPTYLVAQNKAALQMHYPFVPVEYAPYLKGLYVTNTTYAALSMKNGDAFAKKFGGTSGNDSDYFILTIKGFKRNPDNTHGLDDSINVYLADYRSADNSKDYVLKDWKWVDLSKIKYSDSLVFSLTSSDVGQFGMNTPGFFAMDHVTWEMATGVKETAGELAMNLYPNPAHNELNIEVAERANVSIMDVNGRLVLNVAVEPNHSLVTVESLQAGMYIVRVETATGVATRKLIKN